MDISAIQDLYASSSSTPAKKTKELDKDDFLKLLIYQLRYQNPLEPMDDKEFIAQLAQFNSLEQMQNLNSSFEKMLEFQQITQASSLIGKEIKALDSQTKEEITGIVQSVKWLDDEVMLIVGEEEISLAQVREISEGGKDNG